MKIVTVVGARPQFIKAAPLSIQFAEMGIEEIIIHTGQHYDANMSDVFFEELSVPRPKYTLNGGGLSHSKSTSYMMSEIEDILIEEKPSFVVVFGDTNSTLAGALVASKLHIPLVHVESGLRSYNKLMPEEINRVCTDHVSSLCFCPTISSKANLVKENVSCEISISGDIMLDSLNLVKPKLRHIDGIDILVTLHRQENVDNESKLRQIILGLTLLANKRSVHFAVHPRTMNAIKTMNIDLGEINIIPPLGYVDFLSYLSSCELFITDSGGAQKDAYYLKKFSLIIRSETEWVELLDNGVIVLCSPENIENTAKKVKPPEVWPSGIYGNGDAAKVIVKKIQECSKYYM